MTNEELFAILRPVVMTVTGVPECILADQNAASPQGEYASIRPRQSVSERGQANVITVDKVGDLVTTDVRSQIIASCSINFYRGDAMARAERLKQCHKRPDVSSALFMAGVGWLDASTVNNLTALQSSNWEQRAQVTVRVMYEVSDVCDVNNILSSQVILQDENAQVLATVNIP